MMYFNTQHSDRTMIGVANGPSVQRYIERHPGFLDYVEIPFEQLRHNPAVTSLQEVIPVVLHCASMSVASFVQPNETTLEAIENEASRTKTPWIGEHLAFMSADPVETVDEHLKLISNDRLRFRVTESVEQVTSLDYTVCPQLSEETLQRITENLASLRKRFQMPLILENAPQYFDIPGSTMSIVDFLVEFFGRCDYDILMDLTHFVVSSINMGFDPLSEVKRLPLERVVEIHISGFNIQSGVAWDDHAVPAAESVFELLNQVLERARPRAVTFEYNWEPNFPEKILTNQINRVREMLVHSSRG